MSMAAFMVYHLSWNMKGKLLTNICSSGWSNSIQFVYISPDSYIEGTKSTMCSTMGLGLLLI